MATRALLGAAALAASAAGVTVTLRNDEPRLDTDGNILATGDGCITYDPDTARYYLWGTHYQACPEPDSNCYAGNGTIAPCQQWAEVAPGECCGWRNMTIASYSSPDLTSGSWRLEGRNILPILTEPGSPYNSAHGAYFEACGAFNRRTGFWTMWYLDRGYTKGTAVATAPGGPFEIVSWDADLKHTDPSSADYYLWLDVATGNMIMKHNGDGGEYAATLTPDWLQKNATSAQFGHELGYTEGGGIFQYGGSTYVMAGFGCCFCPLGSNGYLWKADDDRNVTGTYTLQGDMIPRSPNKTSVTHAQQFSVTPVYTSAGVVPMFVGIRFGSAPDNRKDHDFQYWAPLTFDAATGRMNNMSWVDSFDLDLVAPTAPPVPPLPTPAWKCSLSASAKCFQVPPTAPGPVYATESDCARSCTLCNLAGTWFGSEPNIPIAITQTPISNSSAAVTCAAPAANWPTNATGVARIGSLSVQHGWCSGTCSATISGLDAAGPPCALISWGPGSSWCNAAVDPRCTYGAGAAAMRK